MTTPSILTTFELSDAQRDAALARGRDVAVTAGAGTGKTRTLVARFLALLDDELPLRRIVAVTFTRKAAREMRNRVRAEIAAYLANAGHDGTAARWDDIYNDLDAARIGTIHNLCGEILRTHPAEAGIDPRFDVLDETQGALLVGDAAEAALAWAAGQEAMGPLFALLNETQLLDLIATLLKQRLAVGAIIAAVPAETIGDHWAARLAAMQAEALDRLLADPAWRAAQATLRDLEPLDSEDKLAAQVVLVRNTLDDRAGKTTAEQLRDLAVVDEINLGAGSIKAWPNRAEDKETAKNALRTVRELYRDQPIFTLTLNPLDDAAAAAMPALYALFAQAKALYEARKEERGALDFDDLEAGAIDLLATHPDVAAYWQTQIGALLVDEFQDTNASQRRLVRLLCPEPGKLFIVGDVKQSIYRFRGADVTVFSAEKQQIDAQDGRLLDLDVSYRAHAALLEGMNRLLRPVLGEADPLRPWLAPFAPLHPGHDEVRDGLRAPYIRLQLSIGRKNESLPCSAAALASELGALRRQGVFDYGDVAILCRSSNSFPVYEDALDAAGIPYVTVAGKGFYNRPEIRDLLNALTAIADPHDDLALVGLLRSPACGLSDESIYRLVRGRPKGRSLWVSVADAPLPDPDEAARLADAVALIGDLNAQAGRTSVADLLKALLDRTHYRAGLRRAGQERAVRNVSKLLLDVYNSELVSVGRFLEYAQTLRDSGSREGEARATGGGAVQIMSIHAAKGLEFPVVVLGDAARVSRGRSTVLIDPDLGILLPQKDEDDTRSAGYEAAAVRNKEQERAEDKRLLYVALTRAEALLFINGHVTENKGGSYRTEGWLREISQVIPLGDCNLDGDGSDAPRFELSLEGTPVSVTFYRANGSPVVAALTTAAPPPIALPDDLPLLRPLRPPPDPTGRDDTASRLWRVVPPQTSTRAPAWVVGQIVHEALALWRFPDARFDQWTTARAREFGLTAARQLDDAARRAHATLDRFRHQPLYREMDTADRRLHELPYSHMDGGLLHNGIIDILYYRDGRWTIVDFKTDDLRGKTPAQVVAERDYEAQLQRYGTAAEALLGERPRLLVYFLNAPAGTESNVIPLQG